MKDTELEKLKNRSQSSLSQRMRAKEAHQVVGHPPLEQLPVQPLVLLAQLLLARG